MEHSYHSSLTNSQRFKKKKFRLNPLKVPEEQTSKIMEEWKFMNEDTRKTMEFRLLKKLRQRKKKEKKLSATERYQKFVS